MENFNNEPTLFDSVGKGISVIKENLTTETGENGGVLNMNPLNTAGEVVISTLEIAKITQKEHKNIMRDCSVNLSKVCSLLNFEHTYQNAQNKQFYKHYLLPKREALILVSGYSVELRAKIIDRLTELENELKKQAQQSALKCFENADFGKVRVLGDSENPLFCLADICKILEIQNTTDIANAIKREFDDALDLIYPILDNLGREQKAIFISETQLYFVLMRSDKPKAKPFRRWVCDEVLPSIRKTGKYEVRTHAIPKTYAEALLEAGRLALENERLLVQAQKNAPLVKFAENVAHSVNSISVNEFAKILGIKDFGEKKLFAWLRKNDFLNAFNQPYQKYVNLGLFELKEGTYATQKGLNTYTQTLITGKGQIYLSEKIENFLKGGEND